MTKPYLPRYLLRAFTGDIYLGNAIPMYLIKIGTCILPKLNYCAASYTSPPPSPTCLQLERKKEKKKNKFGGHLFLV